MYKSQMFMEMIMFIYKVLKGKIMVFLYLKVQIWVL